MQNAQQVKKKQLMTMVIASSVLIVVVMAGLSMTNKTPPPVGPAQKKDELVKSYAMPTDNIKPEDKWMASGATQIATQQQDLSELKSQLDALKAQQAAQQAAEKSQIPSSASSSLAFPPSPSAMNTAKERVVDQLPPPPPPPPSASGTSVAEAPVVKPVSMIEEIDLGSDDKKKATPNEAAATSGKDKGDKSAHSINSFVPAGAFAKVVFLTGFDAPTGGQAQSNALPIVMRVKSFMTLPNQYKTNLKECFIVANGYGDLASERAYIRTEKLSCVLKNGKILEVPVKGHVAGEDASFGMRGHVVSKQGQLIAKSFYAGLFSGLGSSIAQQQTSVTQTALGTVSTVDPNKAVQAGLAQGVSTASSKVSDFWLNQANSIFPIIEIAAGRVGEVFLMEGADFGELKMEDSGAAE